MASSSIAFGKGKGSKGAKAPPPPPLSAFESVPLASATTSKAPPPPHPGAAPCIPAPATGSEAADSNAHWKGSKWMASLKLSNKDIQSADGSIAGAKVEDSLLEILTVGLREIAAMPHESDLEAFRSLGKMVDQKLDLAIAKVLKRTQPLLKELLKSGLKRLATAEWATSKEFRQKFSGRTFDISLADLPKFFDGLEGMIGRPIPPVLDSMFKEHCDEAPLAALLTAPLAPSSSPSPPVSGSGSSMPQTTAPATSTEPRSQAASNLQAAMIQQNEDAQEVEDFLSGLKLERYLKIFMEQGLDSMDVVLEMQECHMREVGMAVGHILKLQKGIADRRPAPPGPAPGGAGGSQRRVNFTAGAEEVPASPAGQAGPTPGASPSSRSTQEASQNLAEGAFDEAESAASFQEALKAWREGRSAPAEATSAPKAPGSFWSKMGDSDVNLERCSTPVTAPIGSSDTQTQRDLAPSEEKLCCYNCYKQFWKQFAVERSFTSDLPTTPGLPSTADRKLLCSEACGDQWLAGMEKKAEARRKRLEQMEALQEAERTLAAQTADRDAAPDTEVAVA